MDIELLKALLNAHKAIEAERNALAHGHFGTYSKLPDGLLWMSTKDYIAFKVNVTLALRPVIDDVKIDQLNRNIYVYRIPDLEQIFSDIEQIAWIWHHFIRYLQTAKVDAGEASRLYNQICDRKHVAQELVKLRSKPARSGEL
jgi:hypothetical protein